jgi:hypothetical protein
MGNWPAPQMHKPVQSRWQMEKGKWKMEEGSAPPFAIFHLPFSIVTPARLCPSVAHHPMRPLKEI